MYDLQNTLKLIIAVLLLSNFACNSDSKKNLKNATDAIVETPETIIEQTEDTIKDPINSALNTDTKTKRAFDNEIEKVSIKFNSGNTITRINGSITGREIRDYRLNIKEGQNLKLTLVSKAGTPYFNLMEPGEDYIAIYNAAINGNQYEGISKKNGEYTIRVYLMRNAARRNETATYELAFSID